METHSILRIAAVLICSDICSGGKELLAHIISHTVDLNPVKACLFCPQSSLCVFVLNLLDLLDRQSPWLLISQPHHKGIRHGNRTWSYRLMSRDLPAGTASRVAELEHALCPVHMDRICQLCQTRDVFVVVSHQHIGCIQSDRRVDTGHFDHDQSDPALCPLRIMIDHRIIDKPLVRLVDPHRTHYRLVPCLQSSDRSF